MITGKCNCTFITNIPINVNTFIFMSIGKYLKIFFDVFTAYVYDYLHYACFKRFASAEIW